ncbi:MAG: methyltransferase regulatory domain-containing protein, partial [Limnohabitans sp.]
MANMTAQQIEFLRQIPDVAMRETTRDFIGNHQFRRDYWVKGARMLDRAGHKAAVRALRVILITPPESITPTVKTPIGEATLSEKVYKPIIHALADHKPHSLEEISQVLIKEGVDPSQLMQCVVMLLSMNHLSLAQEVMATNQATKTANALNQHIMQLARGNDDVQELASPVTGGGYSTNRFFQLFLLARQQGQKTPRQMAEFAWLQIKAFGQSLSKEGKALSGDEENLKELTTLAEQF